MRKLSVLAALILSCGIMGCQQEEQKSGAMSDEVVQVAVEVTPVTTTSFTRTRAYVGNVTAWKQVKVIPLASERILEYPWENGDYVEQGAMIARIRNEVSKKGLEAMNAQVKSIDAQLAAAKRELARVKSMYESNIVSRQQYDQANDAVTTLNATKLQLLATQDQTKLGLDYAKVIAPISGIISNKTSEVGDIASSAQPLCILNDLETLKVTMNVNEEDTPYLRLGQDVSIRFDAFPGELVTAKVTRILPYVNMTTRTNTVEAQFSNVKLESNNLYKYKPGMYCRAQLSLETTTDAIVIPPFAAIVDPELLAQQVGGQKLRRVFVLKDNNTVEARVIEIGEYAGDVVEVLSGLKPGDKLVTRGHHSLRDGDSVTVRSVKSDVVAAPSAAPVKADVVEANKPAPSEAVPAAPGENVPAAPAPEAPAKTADPTPTAQ